MSVCQGCGTDLPPNKAPGRARKWCSERCRKTQYSAPCVDCGVPTNGSDGFTGQSTRCVDCWSRHHHESRRWTRDAVLAAIRQWADEHGGVPPVASDWHVAMAGTGYPNAVIVQREFGTWSAGVREAGFDPFASGCHGREGEDPEIVAETVRLYRSGLTLVQVADRMGLTQTGVRMRLVKAGEPRRTRWSYPRVAA